ncbi:MAG: hypothetical protein Kow0092_00540 [Deferrisomatales bacterium]
MRTFAFLQGLAVGLAVTAAAWAASGPFEDATYRAGLADPGYGKAAAAADVDRDGDWDLYLANAPGPNGLYRNDGDGTFTDVTADAGEGLADPGYTESALFFDYDGDGWADLYLARGGRYAVGENRLFRNVQGRFVETTRRAGVGSRAFTYAAAAADYDGDGDLDLYLANGGIAAPNTLYRNNGDGTFTDVTAQAGVGDPSFSWMALWGDVTGDGRPDLYVVNGRHPEGEPNTLYWNRGDGTFERAPPEVGAADPGWGLGAFLRDRDGDGDPDLEVLNYRAPPSIWINDGTGRFAPAPDASPEAPEEAPVPAVEGDLDGDGAPDRYEVHWGAENRLLLGRSPGPGWLKVRLLDRRGRPVVAGARVEVLLSEGLRRTAWLGTTEGVRCQPPPEALFPVEPGKRYRVEVSFPSRARVSLEGVAPGELLTVAEPGAEGEGSGPIQAPTGIGPPQGSLEPAAP